MFSSTAMSIALPLFIGAAVSLFVIISLGQHVGPWNIVWTGGTGLGVLAVYFRDRRNTHGSV